MENLEKFSTPILRKKENRASKMLLDVMAQNSQRKNELLSFTGRNEKKGKKLVDTTKKLNIWIKKITAENPLDFLEKDDTKLTFSKSRRKSKRLLKTERRNSNFIKNNKFFSRTNRYSNKRKNKNYFINSNRRDSAASLQKFREQIHRSNGLLKRVQNANSSHSSKFVLVKNQNESKEISNLYLKTKFDSDIISQTSRTGENHKFNKDTALSTTR